ncbi:hypothetical protein [Nocardioides sp. AX2bis]|uniref:hypothetical protein n=1 Tax=Nocardioides sp. AX2bis TaxID=2653157 RepID=UPI00135C8BD0|nr:hypothetical protein [Nocardioides sp. AX2bis]
MTPPRRDARPARVLAPSWFGHLMTSSLAVGEHFAATGSRVPEHARRSSARTEDKRPPALDVAGAL